MKSLGIPLALDCPASVEANLRRLLAVVGDCPGGSRADEKDDGSSPGDMHLEMREGKK